MSGGAGNIFMYEAKLLTLMGGCDSTKSNQTYEIL